MSKIKLGEQFLEIFNDFFQKEADKSKYGAVFKFGSLDYKRDIIADVDVYFSPNKKVHPVDFYKEHHRFMSELKQNLVNDYGSDLIPFPTVVYKPEVVTLSNRVLDDVLFHNLVFMNVSDIFNKSKVITNKVLQSEQINILNGDINDVSNFTNLDFLFNFYQFVAKDTTLSNYDKELNSLKVIDQVNYVKKNLANEKSISIQMLSNEDATKLMFEGLDIIKDYYSFDKLVA
ncbi:hypothetical protein K9L67_02100 [Candidatus Woesearchaeota archaeon]|nr:hypothetical protein [Candidatus Woesearchaeota archaeon]MCF7900996.1 hypothetical protein [Candidatus Woesearchaeota archaeon]MCF8013288.1 hypothetical protein [Candidatus Woesearchaeota archaeon]